MKTLYEVLGVDRQAAIAEIAQRYRQHLNDHIAGKGKHPLSKRDQRRLQRMRDAYLLLSSPSRRRAYDVQLDLQAKERGRLIERVSVAFCIALLLGGMLLIGQGYRVAQKKLATASLTDASNPAPATGVEKGGNRIFSATPLAAVTPPGKPALRAGE